MIGEQLHTVPFCIAGYIAVGILITLSDVPGAIMWDDTAGADPIVQQIQTFLYIFPGLFVTLINIKHRDLWIDTINKPHICV